VLRIPVTAGNCLATDPEDLLRKVSAVSAFDATSDTFEYIISGTTEADLRITLKTNAINGYAAEDVCVHCTTGSTVADKQDIFFAWKIRQIRDCSTALSLSPTFT